MRKIHKYKLALAWLDFFTVFWACILSNTFYHVVKSASKSHPVMSWYVLIFFLISSIIFVLIFQYHNLYKINIVMAGMAHTVNLTKSIFFGVISMITLSVFLKFPLGFESRVFLLLFTFNAFVLLLFFRVFVFRWIYSVFAQNKFIEKSIIIIGAGKAGSLLATRLLVEKELGIRVIGFLDDNISKGKKILNDLEVLGSVKEIASIAENHKIHEVIIAIDNIEFGRLLELIDLCNSQRLIVKTSSELFGIINEKVNLEKYNGIPIVDASPIADNSFFMLYKRMFDIILTTVGIICLLPFIVPIIILIRISSRGPVFYNQTRIGKNGAPFKFFKFRSMTVQGEEDEERKKEMIDFIKNSDKQKKTNSKIVNENRVTAIGNFLRKTSLDELPQLINVLKGEMSLVGPRPCLPYEYENYDEWQKRRVLVIPGCTGLWQVSGRSEVSFVDSVVLDIYYINKMSPWLDLQIILKTIPVMLFAKGGK